MHYGTACQLEHLFDNTSTQDADQDQRRSRSLMQVGGAPTRRCTLATPQTAEAGAEVAARRRA
jgi:hypothetical protein